MRGHHWSCSLGVLLSPPVPSPKSPLGYLLLPGPTDQPEFGAEWADLSHETSTEPCKWPWRLSWGGSKGAQAAFWWNLCFTESVCKIIWFPKCTSEVCSHRDLWALWGEKHDWRQEERFGRGLQTWPEKVLRRDLERRDGHWKERSGDLAKDKFEGQHYK